MKTRCFAVLVTLAFLGFSVPAAADPCRVPDESHKHCKDRGGGGDEPTSTFDVVVTIEGSTVICDNMNCESKSTRDDRLDRTTSLVVRGMDMTVPLQLFLGNQFNNGCFGLDMDGTLSIFEPRASRGTISVQISFKGLATDGSSEQEYGFTMFCTIPDDAISDDAIWVPDDNTEPVILACEGEEWILSSSGSLDRCEQETQGFFSEDGALPTKIEVSGPHSVN